MKRGRSALVLLTLFALSACSTLGPGSQTVTAIDPADAGKAVLSVRFGTPHDLRFSAGLTDVRDLRVRITGSDLRVNAPSWCKADLGDILCNVSELPAGRNFILPMTGSNISIVAKYKRDGAGGEYSAEVRQ